jgi:D-alanine-D-alanine ligase-like ATP-grasp enzyme
MATTAGAFLLISTPKRKSKQPTPLQLEEGSAVLVERHILGDEHRLLVVGNQVVAAAKGETVWIVGDGKHTVVELINLQINSDPRRGTAEECPLNPVRVDSAVELELTRQKLSAKADSGGRATGIYSEQWQRCF